MGLRADGVAVLEIEPKVKYVRFRAHGFSQVGIGAKSPSLIPAFSKIFRKNREEIS
jgi:hypothetical protein